MYMARAGPQHVGRVAIGLRRKPPARAFGLERVTRIELALSSLGSGAARAVHGGDLREVVTVSPAGGLPVTVTNGIANCTTILHLRVAACTSLLYARRQSQQHPSNRKYKIIRIGG